MYDWLLEERADVMEKLLKEESEERERAMAAKEEECMELRKELRQEVHILTTHDRHMDLSMQKLSCEIAS